MILIMLVSLRDVFRLRDKFELMKLESYYGYKLVGQCLYIEYKKYFY